MKKIRAFMGEHEKIAEDRPYTHSEISKLLGATSYRNRAIILLMASAVYYFMHAQDRTILRFVHLNAERQ
jgi:hypothetical protein